MTLNLAGTKTVWGLLFVLALSGCQTVPKQSVDNEKEVIDWKSEALIATSFEGFTNALINMMYVGTGSEIADFIELKDSKNKPITIQRLENSKFNLARGICPQPNQDWIFVSDRQDAEFYFANFRIEHDSTLYWCQLKIIHSDQGYRIADIHNFELNISMVSALEAYEMLDLDKYASKGRVQSRPDIYNLLFQQESIEALESNIAKYSLSENNSLIMSARISVLSKPISDIAIATYKSIFASVNDQNEWPLQQFYLTLGTEPNHDIIFDYANRFGRITGDPVWPLLFWARVERASDNHELARQLLLKANLNDPQNDLPYFALMDVYAATGDYGQALNIRQILTSRFDYILEPEFFIKRNNYEGLVKSSEFMDWKTNR